MVFSLLLCSRKILLNEPRVRLLGGTSCAITLLDYDNKEKTKNMGGDASGNRSETTTTDLARDGNRRFGLKDNNSGGQQEEADKVDSNGRKKNKTKKVIRYPPELPFKRPSAYYVIKKCCKISIEKQRTSKSTTDQLQRNRRLLGLGSKPGSSALIGTKVRGADYMRTIDKLDVTGKDAHDVVCAKTVEMTFPKGAIS
uniref:Ribosomal_L2_C domain-containing protein n=1 Tax=Steinernema glaseri TaxID=37863 RepID=A0A1I7YER9_9BILA